MATIDVNPADRDERLGEAVEEFLSLVESGAEPDPEEFASQYPDLGDDLKEALEGLSLVRGLVGSGNGRRLERGRRLAGYRIVGELGSGGMGTVYEAVHVDLDRPVALKVLDSRATRDGNGMRRFLNEAKTAAGLHHTHIVPVFDVGHVGGLCYYAMQRIEGSGLDRVIKALRRDRPTAAGSGSGRRSSLLRRPAPPEPPPELSGLSVSGSIGGRPKEAGRAPEDAPPPYEPPKGLAYYRWVAEVGRQAAQALAYAHRRGVVHRDVKPSNLLVDARGNVWVADFGLARRMADPSLTHSEALIGTPRYMSPEQSRSQPADGRTDVYSLGATLYELLTLRPPFEGKSTAELIEQIGKQEPAPPRRIDPRIPRDLETIVLKALGKRPADRYPEAAELAEDLRRFLEHEPVQARRIGPAGRMWRLARRHPAASAVATVAAALVLATATIAYVRVVQERDRAVSAEKATQAALREGLLRQAQLARISPVSDRRGRGLALLTEAARRGPDADLRARLREEAIAFLALRDVEKRPEIATGRPAGLAFAGADRLVTLANDGEAYTLWSAADGRAVGAPRPAGPAREARPSDRSDPRRPGRRLAVTGPLGAVVWPDGRGLRLFDPAGGEATGDLPMPGREVQAILAVDAPAGARLVVVDRPAEEPRDRRNGPRGEPPPPRVALWDPARPGAPIAELDGPRPPEGPFAFPVVATSPEGDAIATGWFQGTSAALWSADDGHALGEPIELGSPLRSLAMGPFGQLAAAGVGAVRLWDIRTRRSLATLTPHQSNARLLRFSPDGTMLAIAGFNASDVELWDPAGNTQIAALTTAEPVGELAFAPDGGLLAAGQPAAVATWAIVDSPVRSRATGLEGNPTSLAFAPDGRLAIAFFIRDEAPARIWHPGRCPTTARTLGDLKPLAVAFDDRGRLVAATPEALVLEPDSGPPGAPPPARLELPEPRLPDEVWDQPGALNWLRSIHGVAQGGDGRRIALVRPSEVLLWDAEAPGSFRVVALPPPAWPRGEPPPGAGPGPRPKGEPGRRGGRNRGRNAGWVFWSGAVIDPAARRLYAIGRPADELVGWDLRGENARPLGWSLPEVEASALALSADGRTLALGTRDGEVLLIEAATGRVLDRLAPPGEEGEPITCLAFSPRGPARLAAGTHNGAVRLHHLPGSGAGNSPASTAGDAPLSLPRRHGDVLALSFDHDGRQLAAAGADKVVEVWDLDRLERELGRLGMAW